MTERTYSKHHVFGPDLLGELWRRHPNYETEWQRLGINEHDWVDVGPNHLAHLLAPLAEERSVTVNGNKWDKWVWNDVTGPVWYCDDLQQYVDEEEPLHQALNLILNHQSGIN